MSFLEIMGCAMISFIVCMVIVLVAECIYYVVKRHTERNKLLKEIKQEIDEMKETKKSDKKNIRKV